MEYSKTALLVVDNLECFHKGGSLAVPGAEKINEFINKMRLSYDYTVVVQEWHPENHCSFVENGGDWPKHGLARVNGPEGSNFHPDMDVNGAIIFQKGMNSKVECYGAFEDEEGTPTGLDSLFEQLDVGEVAVAGLATEYCVKATAMQAKKRGYETSVIVEGVAGITEEGIRDAFEVMKESGIILRLKG